MSLNESIVEDAALEWFLLRQGFRLHRGFGGHAGGLVGDPPSPPAPSRLWRSGRLRWTGLGHADGREAAFAELRRAKPSLAPGEYAGGTLTRPLPRGEEKREAIRRLNPAIPDRTLATLRDPAGAGLPKLLSGELGVADADEVVHPPERQTV